MAALLLSLFLACGEQPVASVVAEPPPAPASAPAPAAPPAAPAVPGLAADASPALTNPSLATATAPDSFKVRFDTNEGPFVIQVHRKWAPNGADRFFNLVQIGFFNDARFFRVVDRFMVQFGLSGHPEVNAAWRDANLVDDAVLQHNTRGRISFATAGPNTRTTQMFINFVDNTKLDPMGFAPFGEVVEGMDVVDKLYKGYGEGAPGGRGPSQGRIQVEGNAYLVRQFPELDYITGASVIP